MPKSNELKRSRLVALLKLKKIVNFKYDEIHDRYKIIQNTLVMIIDSGTFCFDCGLFVVSREVVVVVVVVVVLMMKMT